MNIESKLRTAISALKSIRDFNDDLDKYNRLTKTELIEFLNENFETKQKK